jgi:hypothetical protein
VEGVVVVDPDKRVNRAYPLSMLTYAAVNVCSPTLAALGDYADLIDYAVGKGQVSGVNTGQLPLGYVPLTSAFVTQSVKTSKAIRAEVKKPECASHITTETPQTPETPTVPDSVETPPVVDTPTESITPPVAEEAPTVEPPTAAAAALETTKASSTDASRYALLAAFFFGIACFVFGPLLLRFSK